MAANPAIASLQAAINRYSVAVAPIGVDGALGPKTAESLIKVLGWIANNVAGARETAAGLVARLVTEQGAYDYAQITASAPGLTIYLGDRADEKGLPRSGAIVPSSKPIVQTTRPTTAPNLVLDLKRPSYAASLAEALAKMPKWASYGGGALLAFGALAAVILTSKRRKAKALPAVSGHYPYN